MGKAQVTREEKMRVKSKNISYTGSTTMFFGTIVYTAYQQAALRK